MPIRQMSLNPCCSGRWSRTNYGNAKRFSNIRVLILIVVDDGLVHDDGAPVVELGDKS